MSSRDASPAAALRAEWDRIHLLGYCLSRSRQGEDPARADLARLEKIQARVDLLRGDGAWERVTGTPLSPIELDVLACASGPEVDPRIGWMYQTLQGGLPQPYPSRALIQDLLALAPEQLVDLDRALAPGSRLLDRRLIRTEPGQPYHPIRLQPYLSARLLGGSDVDLPPPGAVAVKVVADWDALVLPPSRVEALRELLLWIRERRTVVDRWGGLPVGGPVALFTGASGTGKTLAAAVIARDLGWPLYLVDLGRLVSKYVGETEENLNALFDAAHGRPMVLQFDEADSLFSKRGEVKEARDRYANMEVSHLLSRIERHEGPCILTTNLRRQMDPAFARRFQMVIDFPRPDAVARARLWERLLPPRAPREPDVDPVLLGGAVSLTGGSIRNAALHAAYLAAGNGGSLSLPQIALAVWRELGKEGREVTEQDLGPLSRHLPEVFHD
jgi:hypothetical protein